MACKGIRIGPRYGSKGSYLTQAWISRVVDVAERQVLRGFKGKKSYWYHRESPHVLCITGTIQQFETHKALRCYLGQGAICAPTQCSRPNPPSRETLERLIWFGQQGPPSHSRWRGEPPSRVSPVLEQPARGQISADP
ncbi:hypothetical protein MCOR16_010984 [Pyricularia oryzae]|nr:hypothetical protein MCOR16_010984 [Pyricularia oryzae]